MSKPVEQKCLQRQTASKLRSVSSSSLTANLQQINQNTINQVNKMKDLGELLRSTTKGDDKSAIDQAMHELNSFTRPLAEVALDHAVASALVGNKPV